MGGAPSGGPNLGAPPAGGPNLSGAPSGGPSLGAPVRFGNEDLQAALGSLKKVSEEEKSKPPASSPAPMGGAGMFSEDAIKGALSSLKSVPKEERKEVTGISGPGLGGITEGAIKNALSSLKSVKKKEEKKDKEDDVLEKEANVEEMSAEEMKSLLQEKLKAAFK